MTQKFSEKHKTALIKTLKKYSCPEGIKNIYELEGFLVGALCCPERLDLDDMIDAIFRPKEDAPIEWDSKEEVELFFDGVFALQNKNNNLLQAATYKPKLLKNIKERKKWCRGFLRGFGEEGLECAEQMYDDKNYQAAISVICATVGMSLSDITPQSPVEDAEIFAAAIEKLTIKELAEFVKYLFFKTQKDDHSQCCGEGHHHSHNDETMFH